ncbi:MAG: anti-sigma factor antagonist [Planctomycetota bacterium]|nr:MAG: anti-sigma factor antagonist [Planctomycetota bacterium]
MKAPKRAPFSAATSGEALYVRLRGLGSMHNAPTLEAFADRALENGVCQLVFDFQRCTGVDSTFMGLLLDLSNRLRERAKGRPLAGVVLINVDEHALKQLSSVGVDAFVTIKPGRTPIPPGLKLIEVDSVEASTEERLKLMVRVHKELVASDARNKAKFGAFLEGIIAELNS